MEQVGYCLVSQETRDTNLTQEHDSHAWLS